MIILYVLLLLLSLLLVVVVSLLLLSLLPSAARGPRLQAILSCFLVCSSYVEQLLFIHRVILSYFEPALSQPT